MSAWVTCENRPVTKANKKQKANIIQKLLAWQEIKHTTHQFSSPERHDCSKHSVAGNLCVFIYTCVFSAWTEVCFPSLLRVMGVCSPLALGGSTEETTGAKLHPARLFLLLSPFQQMASLSRLQPETRPGDGAERGGNLPLQIPGTHFIWTRLGSTRNAANPAWTPRYTVTFPTNGSGIHLKKSAQRR